ncbi:MAG: T9SS type A sorting domain-containing protein, partial [Bacteroidales bacterium]|nr:T9SS type A sorting domain-containing protein [Bacteroidales bacterium]
LLSRPLAYGNEYKATLNCINQSLLPLKSVEYAYSVNGKAEKKQNITFADSLKGMGEAAAIDFVFDITETNLDTTNRIQIWPVSVDSVACTLASGDTLDFTLSVVDEARLDQDYVPMLESFTSATCGPCRLLNPYLNPVLVELKKEGKLNVVKYQMNVPYAGDTYYISDNGTRSKYYNVSGIPTLVFNGMEKPLEDWTATTYNGLMNELREKVDAASQNKAFFSIKVNRAEVKPDSTVELDFDVTSHLPGATSRNMRIYAMVIEGTTYGNQVSISEKKFHYVNMAFATSSSGQSAYFSQERTNNYTYTVNMKRTHVEELTDLQAVIFVQDPTDKYIYQSAGVVMGDGDHYTAVESDELAQVSVYPNPAAHTVYVAGLEKARVEIFDLGGRRVYEKTDADGVLEVSLASFAKGAYVVRIAQNGAVASRKLVVK